MNQYAIAIVFAIVLFAFVIYFKNKENAKKVKKNEEKLKNAGIQSDGRGNPANPLDATRFSIKGMQDDFQYKFSTPEGASILSIADIPESVRARVFEAIEMGLKNLLAATTAKFPHWTNAAKISDFRIAFIEPHQANLDGSPALMVYGQYQTAGTVIGIANDGYPIPTIVLPHQAKTDWRYLVYLMYSVWNEGEHFREFANDNNLAMSFTGANDVHQHHNLPEGVSMLMPVDAAARGFKSAALPRCNFDPTKII